MFLRRAGAVGLFAATLAVGLSERAAVAAAACTTGEMQNILRPATDGNSLTVTCNFQYPSNPAAYMPSGVQYPGKITRRLAFSGASSANVTFDCADATISPTFNRSSPAITVNSDKRADGSWFPATGVLVRRCTVEGKIAIAGGDRSVESNRNPNYTAIAQATAPQSIKFERITQILNDVATDAIGFYFGPGVRYSTLIDSEIKGTVGVAIYMAPESAWNDVINNTIHASTPTDDYQQMSIDGSAHNHIFGNYFSGLDHGGIYIFRNCGESGTIRHQKPWGNEIVNNFFYYNKYDGSRPAVWVGARMRTTYVRFKGTVLINEKDPDYCWKDDDLTGGSADDNTDNAAYTVVAQNQIQSPDSSLTVAKMFRGPLDLDKGSQPFFLLNNNQAGSSLVRQETGCLVYPGGATGRPNFVSHGDFEVWGDTSRAYKATCIKGFYPYPPSIGTPVISQFDCPQESLDAGCSKRVLCPTGRKVVQARAVCNLETTSASLSQAQAEPWGQLHVLKPSDTLFDGLCGLDEAVTLFGTAPLWPVTARDSVVASCHEHDKNGGDCNIVGEIACF